MDRFFSHVFGQEKVKEQIERLWQEQRLPHTLIFYGEEGLGKTTAAFEVAGLLTGEASRMWSDISHWDRESDKIWALTAAKERVWYLQPLGTQLKIDQFRLFLEAMASFDGSTRVCIIDEAQTMKDEIANSLLKTLEEPMGEVYFIVITHDIDALLPTILSRGEKFPFFPLSEEAYRSWLSSGACASVPAGMTEELLYQLSEGNPGVTLDICEETGDLQPNRAMEFWEKMTFGRMPFSELELWKIGERKDFLRLLRWILLVGRDIMVVSEIPDSKLIRALPVEDRIRKVAPYWRDGRAEAAMEILQTAMQGCRRYISVKNIWDMILIRLHHIRGAMI